MRTIPNEPRAEPAPSKPANAKPSDIASASVPDTLAALHVNPDTGLTHAEVDVRRKEHGYNEVAEKKGHPVLMFLGKFWGLSAWMLELIMVLSAVLGKFSDLAVVGALLVVNAVLSFMQEHRALAADALTGTVLTLVGLPGILPLPGGRHSQLSPMRWSPTLL